ncbi:tyrosine-type recombinase/integrase [Exiguobacterium sp. S90]|uniref:tyrosine-type recombinase/integrase n=1 Tax=Exiguobacterium sp. S90 TaxID=1221231 RepID=UPI001BEC823D|nr:tyrosine-type recombinase/integrase [Exiguobacterium sp. S90]
MMTFYLDRLLALIEASPTYSRLTKKAYRSDVRHLCRHATALDLPSLRRYITLLHTTYAPTTVARRIHALATLFDALVAERSLAKNPLKQIKKPARPSPKLRTAFSYPDARRVIDTLTDEATYAFYFLLLHTGLRFSEAHQLTCADLDFTERHLFVRHGKGDKSRFVPLNDELTDVLLRYIETERPDGEYLFLTDQGRRLRPDTTRKQLRQASEVLLGRTLRPHDLRVTFATTLYREHQTDLLTVMRLLGHSDAKTTQQYILPSAEVARSSINRLTPTRHRRLV